MQRAASTNSNKGVKSTCIASATTLKTVGVHGPPAVCTVYLSAQGDLKRIVKGEQHSPFSLTRFDRHAIPNKGQKTRSRQCWICKRGEGGRGPKKKKKRPNPRLPQNERPFKKSRHPQKNTGRSGTPYVELAGSLPNAVQRTTYFQDPSPLE